MGIDPATYDLIFYSAPFSRANRHFPIGNLDKWTVHTVTTVKTFEDVVTSVTVPWFDGWDVVNLIKNTKTGYVYWVTASSVSTLSSKSVAFELLYNAPTSILKAGDSLTGVWDRLPTNECPYLRENVIDDAMKTVSLTPIPGITHPDNFGSSALRGKRLYWYEVVMRQPIDTNTDRMSRYGGFATLESSNGSLTSISARYHTTDRLIYPSLNVLVNSFSTIHANASPDKIVAINISPRCPYEYAITDAGSNKSSTGIMTKDLGGNDVPAVPTKFNAYGDGFFALYDLDNPLNLASFLPPAAETEVTITCTDAERKYGEFSLTLSGVTLNTIPNEAFTGNSLTVGITARSDFTNLYTDVRIGESIIRIPEGKLPWTGNAWSEYQVRSMTYDRESMNLSISAAKDQRNIDAIASLSNTAMSGAVGYAMGGGVLGGALAVTTAAAGIVGAELQGRLSERTARAEQELKEKNVRSQLSNFYNTSYGVIQLADANDDRGLCVTKAMPYNLSDTYITTYHSELGYRTQGVITHTLQSGRYQGRLTSLPKNGVKGDLLNAEFIEGVKIEIVPDDVFEVT